MVYIYIYVYIYINQVNGDYKPTYSVLGPHLVAKYRKMFFSDETSTRPMGLGQVVGQIALGFAHLALEVPPGSGFLRKKASHGW